MVHGDRRTMRPETENFPAHLCGVEDPYGTRYTLETLQEEVSCFQSGGYLCPHCSMEMGQAIDWMTVHLEREHDYTVWVGFRHEEEFWDEYVDSRKDGIIRRVIGVLRGD